MKHVIKGKEGVKEKVLVWSLLGDGNEGIELVAEDGKGLQQVILTIRDNKVRIPNYVSWELGLEMVEGSRNMLKVKD